MKRETLKLTRPVEGWRMNPLYTMRSCRYAAIKDRNRNIHQPWYATRVDSVICGDWCIPVWVIPKQR